MFIDASALTAILAGEPDAAELLARLELYSVRTTSPIAVWETVVAVTRILRMAPADATVSVEDFLSQMRIEVTEVDADARFFALMAFGRYGKGRHPAALNLGDCFAYACAKLAKSPMLYKGDDFALTDVERA